MPTSTDAKIKQLFGRAIAAKDETQLKRVAKELRAAITEHARADKRPFAIQESMIATSDSAGD